MAYTQQQLDAIEGAIAEGALVVKYADKSVEYRSLDDMLRIRDMMRESLGLNTGAGSSRIVYASFSKGLDCE